MIVPRDTYVSLTPAMQGRLLERWPGVQRLRVAWRIAGDVEALADLLAGCPVDPSRLDPQGLLWARTHELVALLPPGALLGLAEPLDPEEIMA